MEWLCVQQMMLLRTDGTVSDSFTLAVFMLETLKSSRRI